MKGAAGSRDFCSSLLCVASAQPPQVKTGDAQRATLLPSKLGSGSI